VLALSDLTVAMIMHMHYLVHDERRPFSYLDFLKFEVDGHEFKMTHGTFRNNISRLVREGLIEISYRSNITFYTLRGVKFDIAS
jgi:DNA-binding transcriptional ArsR family regulator